MSASKIKGSLLEYIVRKLLVNCGFTKVKPDELFIYNDRGLNFINGKGAAHDADVLMTPPIQMPFSYPYRINFECKAHKDKIGLPIIRNALGLRYDINEFEIVTDTHLRARQNNRRSTLAIDNRQRYNYQVGVASVEEFTKDAFEFAANNKISLISLRWFLPALICDSFHHITDTYLQQFPQQDLEDVLQFLKGNDNQNGERFATQTITLIKDILESLIEFEHRVLIGLLESGDMLFLFGNNDTNQEKLRNANRALKAQYHYRTNQVDSWTLSITLNNETLDFEFYLPKRILEMWESQNLDKKAAIDLKQKFFSKMFIFIRNDELELSFRVINIDEEWLNEHRFQPVQHYS